VIFILKNLKNIALIVLVCCVVVSRFNFLLIVPNVLIVIVIILIIKCAITCLLKAHEDSSVALKTRFLFLIDLLIEKISHWAFPRKFPSSLKIDFYIRNPAKSLYSSIAIENPSLRTGYSPVLLISVITVIS
jgi:dipeptide/tripeptide permease